MPLTHGQYVKFFGCYIPDTLPVPLLGRLLTTLLEANASLCGSQGADSHRVILLPCQTTQNVCFLLSAYHLCVNGYTGMLSGLCSMPYDEAH